MSREGRPVRELATLRVRDDNFVIGSGRWLARFVRYVCNTQAPDRLVWLDREMQCYAGDVCMAGNDPKGQSKFTTTVLIIGGANAVLAVTYIQSKGSKAGELGANVFAGAMALGNYCPSMSRIEQSGVQVDPAIYVENVCAM